MPLPAKVVVREAGEQEAGESKCAIPTNTKIDAGANFRDGAQEKLTSLRVYFICDADTAWRVLAAAHIDQNGLFYAIRVSVFLPEVQLLLSTHS